MSAAVEYFARGKSPKRDEFEFGFGDEIVDSRIGTEQKRQPGARVGNGVRCGQSERVGLDREVFVAPFVVKLAEVIAVFAVLVECPCRVNVFVGGYEITLLKIDPSERVPIGGEDFDLANLSRRDALDVDPSQAYRGRLNCRLGIVLRFVEIDFAVGKIEGDVVPHRRG